MARDLVKSGNNAGSGYGEVWIRDFNTFLRLALETQGPESVKTNLRNFFRLQQPDGSIVDGFIPREKVNPSNHSYDFMKSMLAPELVAYKNTVETDQETSLLQAVSLYIKLTGDVAFLKEKVGDETVSRRMDRALNFLMDQRFDTAHGLIWGATTADWGDVQPEHPLGVTLDKSSHRAIDIYDNAMLLVALDNLISIDPSRTERWQPVRRSIAKNTMTHLWDKKKQKFRPHIYLDGSPFPPGFEEENIFYFGGTAVAMQANLLSQTQISASLRQMRDGVKRAGAASIGLTLYPAYPAEYFKNPIMSYYGYQNGGDWTWFGARTVRELARAGFCDDAWRELQPMLERVTANGDFYEWHSLENKPMGSAQYRGAAGVLYEAILELERAAGQ
jgi:glycogen debranching enzyme